MNFNQTDFEVRCEWGEQGILQLAPVCDVIIVVDVLSFSTCVDIANSQGAIVFPYQWNDATAKEFAQSMNAELANRRGDSGYSLSLGSLLKISPGTRLVLPSPNGSLLSLATGTTPTLAGCLRNSRAVAAVAMKYGRQIGVVPAGERWSDGSLRVAFEDLVGAGAIISDLEGRLSPEAKAAATSYQAAQPHLRDLIRQCGSGQELIERGFEKDVELAVELNVSDCAPVLTERSYVNHAG